MVWKPLWTMQLQQWMIQTPHLLEYSSILWLSLHGYLSVDDNNNKNNGYGKGKWMSQPVVGVALCGLTYGLISVFELSEVWGIEPPQLFAQPSQQLYFDWVGLSYILYT